MNLHLAMGIFALYVVAVSLVRLMSSREIPRLTAMKRAWGRNRGLLVHFLASVALPLVLGVVFMSRGIAGIGAEASGLERDVSWQTAICALTAPASAPEDSCPVSGGHAGDAAGAVAAPVDSLVYAHPEPVSLPWHLPPP